MEDLRLKVERYRGMLALMRRLVPDQNEVPAMIDDISTRAKVRGVTIGRIEPLPVEPGPPFDTYRYRLEIMGHYDSWASTCPTSRACAHCGTARGVSEAASRGAEVVGRHRGTLLEADSRCGRRQVVGAAAGPQAAGEARAKPDAGMRTAASPLGALSLAWLTAGSSRRGEAGYRATIPRRRHGA